MGCPTAYQYIMECLKIYQYVPWDSTQYWHSNFPLGNKRSVMAQPPREANHGGLQEVHGPLKPSTS